MARTRTTIQAIDMHCAGEPLRLVTAGLPPVPHAPILERRRWVLEHADRVRRIAMYEPRGHPDMYGAVLLPPYREDADAAVLFMHNEGYSTMCGHGTIALAMALVEEGLFPATEPETTIRLEAPAGLVTATVETRRTAGGGHEAGEVRFTNVPSYLAERDIELRPDGLALAAGAAEQGFLRVDLGFGGAYYGIVEASDLGLRIVPESTPALTRAGVAITELLRRDHVPSHPADPELSFVYGTVIVDREPRRSPDGRARDADWRNATIFAEAQVDRSPCGSGTSALLAQAASRGWLTMGDEIRNASLTGEIFRGRLEERTAVGRHEAFVTSVAGRAYLTGYSTFVVDERDPLGEGFLLR
ncbi:MAG: proline racemase family protein [Chloroflexota bacterium]|nr:proline racemase family protein [Chloroflexota bacterium]